MSEVRLSNDAFFQHLANLFHERRLKDHWSIFLTQKCMTFGKVAGLHAEPKTSDQLHELRPSNSLPILIRATSARSKENKAGKIKLSTVVEADALEAFFLRYTEVCKSGMSALKKRDRSKVKKKMKAKKRKGSTVGAIDGMRDI